MLRHFFGWNDQYLPSVGRKDTRIAKELCLVYNQLNCQCGTNEFGYLLSQNNEALSMKSVSIIQRLIQAACLAYVLYYG